MKWPQKMQESIEHCKRPGMNCVMYQKFPISGINLPCIWFLYYDVSTAGMGFRNGITSTQYRGICQLGHGGHLNIGLSHDILGYQSSCLHQATATKAVAI